MAKSQTNEGANELGLGSFNQPTEVGLSLDQLSQAFAAMLNTGSDPYTLPGELPSGAHAAVAPTEIADAEQHEDSTSTSQSISDGHCEISPRSILEAMLFVGMPGGQSLTSQQVAGLMRGVRPAEVDELVNELNGQYDDARCPYRIESVETGYRL